MVVENQPAVLGRPQREGHLALSDERQLKTHTQGARQCLCKERHWPSATKGSANTHIQGKGSACVLRSHRHALLLLTLAAALVPAEVLTAAARRQHGLREAEQRGRVGDLIRHNPR